MLHFYLLLACFVGVMSSLTAYTMPNSSVRTFTICFEEIIYRWVSYHNMTHVLGELG